MKDLVIGYLYIIEIVIQLDSDEFMIIVCDGVSFILLCFG